MIIVSLSTLFVLLILTLLFGTRGIGLLVLVFIVLSLCGVTSCNPVTVTASANTTIVSTK